MTATSSSFRSLAQWHYLGWITLLLLLLVGIVLHYSRAPNQPDTSKLALGESVASVEANPHSPVPGNITADGSSTKSLHRRANITDQNQHPVAPSLVDTEIDAPLSFDDEGRLMSDGNLRRYFDYFLTAIGELSIDEIRARFQADIFARLSPSDAARAEALFERYIDYLSASEALVPSADLHSRLEQLSALRRETLGDDLAEAFFGEEEQYTRTVLTEQAILQDGALSPAERQAALESIHQELPEAQRLSREQAVSHHLALEQERQFEQLDISPQQRFEERSALYGDEAADRLAQLDLQRQQWQQRINEYRQQRQHVLDRALSSNEQSIALRELRQNLFDDNEQRRVESLENDGFPGLNDN